MSPLSGGLIKLKLTIPNDIAEYQFVDNLNSKTIGDIMNKLHITAALAALGICLALPALAQNVQDQSKPQNPEAADQSSPVGQGATTDNATKKPSANSKAKQKRKQKPSAKSSKESDAANKSGTGTSSQEIPDSNQGKIMKPDESQPGSTKKKVE